MMLKCAIGDPLLVFSMDINTYCSFSDTLIKDTVPNSSWNINEPKIVVMLMEAIKVL